MLLCLQTGDCGVDDVSSGFMTDGSMETIITGGRKFFKSHHFSVYAAEMIPDIAQFYKLLYKCLSAQTVKKSGIVTLWSRMCDCSHAAVEQYKLLTRGSC